MGESKDNENKVTIPEGVDMNLLMKVLGNPEMTALLTSFAKTMKEHEQGKGRYCMDGNLCGIVLAGVYHTLTFYYISKYRQNINNTEYTKESLFKFKTDFLFFY